MKDLIKKEKEQLGSKIQKLRELLSLTQSQLGKTLGISKGTIASMEAGKRFTGDYLLAVVHFFGMNLSEFSNFKTALPDELALRSRIKEYHKKHGSTAYTILDEPPNLNTLIEFRLVTSDFFTTPKTVKEIIDYCSSEYKLSFKSSVVSQALINATKSGILKRTKTNGRVYKYQARKAYTNKNL